MPKIVIVETNGSLKELTCRDVTEAGLYKAIKLKNAVGFALRATWDVTVDSDTFSVMLYSKTDGKAGQENKYDFPPPVDSALFFGKCVLVNQSGDLTVGEWNRIYEHLFGGFEDLNSGNEDEDEDDDDEYDELPLTTAGYAKDGFVVDSGASESEESEEEEEEEEEVESDDSDAKSKKKKPKPKPKAKAPVKPRTTKNKAADPRADYTEELTEEAYV